MSTSDIAADPLGIHQASRDIPSALGRSVVAVSQPVTHDHAVSWSAILAGAAAAAALSLILLLLGSGLGLAAVSPWAQSGISAAAFGVAAILWATLTQVAAAGLGGYLAGRLRCKWVGVHGDETYFRDTAHGFLAWAIATLATAAWLGAAASAVVGGAAQAGASVAGGAVAAVAAGTAAGAGASTDKPDAAGVLQSPQALDYAVESLFRAPPAAPAAAASSGAVPAPVEQASTSTNAAVGRVFMNALRTGALPEQDLKYVAQLVAERTGVSPQDAEKRVSGAYAQVQAKWDEAKNAAKEAADKTRKATSHAALWLFISLLIGAFVASVTALWGGRQRDL